MSDKLQWFWLSFSLSGVNQGVCVVEANDELTALQKADELDLIPEYDDIECFALGDKSEIPPEILFTPQQMKDKEYESVRYTKCLK